MRGILLAVLLAGCAPKSAEGVADKFVDLYFVEIDQRRVLPLTTALAHNKIEEELSLVANVRQQYDPGPSKPTIHYKRQTAAESGARARFTYDITVEQGRDVTKRNALISLERVDGNWRVANFIVREGHLPVRPGPATAEPPSPPASR